MSYAQQPYPAPPQQGYPGYGYNPYPPAYAHDPSAVYYAPTYAQADSGGASCFRCICTVMLLSLLLAFIASLVVFLASKPGDMSASVYSLKVSGFSINPLTKVVTGKWEAKMYIAYGHRTRLSFNFIEPSLQYQKKNWSVSLSKDLRTESDWRDHATVKYTVESNNSSGPAPVEDIEKEMKETGGVTFSLNWIVNYIKRTSEFLTWHHKYGTMRIECRDLKISLASGSNNGSLAEGSKNCRISGE